MGPPDGPSRQGELEKPTGTLVAHLAQKEEGRASSMESTPEAGTRGCVEGLGAPTTPVVGGRGAQAPCDLEPQTPVRALLQRAAPMVGLAEWVLQAFIIKELAELTMSAIEQEPQIAAKTVNCS